MMHSCDRRRRARSRAWAAAALAVCVSITGCDGRDDGGANQGASDRAEPTGRPGDDAAARRSGDTESREPIQAPLGTFSPEAQARAAAGEQGRLPAEGDLTLYIPATDLFPGAARLDPGVSNPYSGDDEAIAAGERHFAAFNCGGCHAPLGGGGMGPPLSDDAWIYGGTPGQIYLSIMHGRPQGMPAWSSMLPRRTTWELVAYIETLSEIDDYAAEKGFDSPRAGEVGTEETSTGQ